MRYREADRIVTLYTRERGRLGAIAKGVRRTKSKVGGRLEPFSLVRASLYSGRGLYTVVGVDTLRTFQGVRDELFRMEEGARLFLAPSGTCFPGGGQRARLQPAGAGHRPTGRSSRPRDGRERRPRHAPQAARLCSATRRRCRIAPLAAAKGRSTGSRPAWAGWCARRAPRRSALLLRPQRGRHVDAPGPAR